ncbi:MAG: uL30 family ribosomal protein [archaeon]|jgi:large subunit ribosomal protein L30
MYAVIRIRGSIGVSPKIKKTFELLNLNSVNNMSVWPENTQTLKMIKIVANHSTYGNINDETIKELITKKGKAIEGTLDIPATITGLTSGKRAKELNLKNCFKMSPPRQGYDRKGIKKPYSLGGALGNRKEAINELVKKMM